MSRHPLPQALALVLFAAAACGGSWESAVDRANRDGKPLVIEFHASWCGPCKKFERIVLTDSRVKEALHHVTFERFDFDSTAGKHHARRLGVTGVPTFIAVGRDGQPIGGLRGAVGVERFLQFLAWTQNTVNPPATSRRAQSP